VAINSKAWKKYQVTDSLGTRLKVYNNNKLLGRSSENLLIKVNASESQAKKYLGQIQKVQITKSFRTEAEGMLLI
jgi:type IV secretory pathway protease TraF